jgi:hypothetical protein
MPMPEPVWKQNNGILSVTGMLVYQTKIPDAEKLMLAALPVMLMPSNGLYYEVLCNPNYIRIWLTLVNIPVPPAVLGVLVPELYILPLVKPRVNLPYN